ADVGTAEIGLLVEQQRVIRLSINKFFAASFAGMPAALDVPLGHDFAQSVVRLPYSLLRMRAEPQSQLVERPVGACLSCPGILPVNPNAITALARGKNAKRRKPRHHRAT